jgi:hypothetical protein
MSLHTGELHLKKGFFHERSEAHGSAARRPVLERVHPKVIREKNRGNSAFTKR